MNEIPQHPPTKPGMGAMTEITPFSNDEFSLEFIPDGDSFKVAASGLARYLGFRAALDLARGLPESEKGYELVRTPGGEQRVLMVTEPGFYRALGQRQAARITNPAIRAQVVRFQSWVYGEVLPSLRRAGAQVPTGPLRIDPTVKALAELAHRQHVVPMAGRVLAYERWHRSDRGLAAFVQLTINLGIPGVDAPVEVKALTAKDVPR